MQRAKMNRTYSIADLEPELLRRIQAEGLAQARKARIIQKAATEKAKEGVTNLNLEEGMPVVVQFSAKHLEFNSTGAMRARPSDIRVNGVPFGGELEFK